MKTKIYNADDIAKDLSYPGFKQFAKMQIMLIDGYLMWNGAYSGYSTGVYWDKLSAPIPFERLKEIVDFFSKD